MTPEDRKLLEETYTLAKKNNDLLVYVKRHAQVGTAVKVVYWVIIIALSLGALVVIKPYMEFLKGVSGGNDTASQDSLSQQIQELIN